ncbi:type III polyketide synthase [Mesohalobacter halotolerans]|uniref:Type III polyketide synthase n=1 Tax=Mesohalobacter halotolerans TaxID=1883405 RepID=A0A4U5TNZ2_9FLAO|nr:3-oxoacyl-[acyl-carrier-protein] synthase III C-terminal domain-containing protein [Mesohalobacter halotolerans]TKS55777.1 type III polyketide synthase [Mesohalobacter halotolerans]
MNQVKIHSVATQLPKYSQRTWETIPLLKNWLKDEDERYIRKAEKIFEGAQVDQRYAIMPPEDVFTKTTFEDKNNLYKEAAKLYGKQVLEKALSKSGWKPESLDYIITVSCTGIMIPSLDAYLINSCGLKQNIVRLPITEMGCVGGVSAMIYAYQFLKSNPNKRAAIIAFESPTATFQYDDKSMVNIVSSAIFGDGAACVLMSSNPEDKGVEVIADQMYHFYDKTHMMGFDLVNTGLKMILDIEVPDTIAEHFPKIIEPFLKHHNLDIKDIDHLIFHPGGKKIIEAVDNLFGKLGKNINHTKAVLKEFGNMSSATVLFVLERFMDEPQPKDTIGMVLSFGPGFTAQNILLKW